MKILVLTKEGGGRGNPNVYRFDWTKGVKKSPFKPKKRVTLEPVKGDTAMTPEPSSIEPSSSPKGADAPIHIAKDYTTKTIDRTREVGFDATSWQKSNWGQGWARFATPEVGKPPSPEKCYGVIRRIVEKAEAGYFLSVDKAVNPRDAHVSEAPRIRSVEV